MRPLNLAAATLAWVALGSCSFIAGPESSDEPAPVPKSRSVAIDKSRRPPPQSPITAIVEDALSSVVNVRTTALTEDASGNRSQGKGEGSGVIIGSDGIVVTNNHVVEGAVSVTVVLNGGRSVEGEVLGTDPQRDLAVIEVAADGLEAIELGDSSSLRLGDTVLAIGYPLGLGGPSVTQGIISGEKRTITAQGPAGEGTKLEGLLQTDAAINPGNSGGALVDRAGRLVGINTAAATPGAAENLGFAIAVDGALPIIEEILDQEPEERAWLGVLLDSVDAGVAAQLGLDPATRGALIVETLPDGPAADAGLSAGDVVVSADGGEVASDTDLIELLSKRDPGDTLELTIVGDEGRRSLEVELEQRPVTVPG